MPRAGIEPPTRAAVPAGASDWPRWLCCPVCHGDLAWDERSASCQACARSYPIDGGVPVLVAGGVTSEQADHFDQVDDPEYEIERPCGAPALHRWILAEKARRSVSGIESGLAGASALTICGGSGMDAEWLARAGADVISSDLSIGAAQRATERARRHGIPFRSIVADAERLPVRDRSVDLVYVHDGLHHLDRPEAGLVEMLRVARKAVSINEPARASLTALAVRVGLASESEESGNRIARQSLADLVAAVRSAGFRVVGARRYPLFYRHRPGLMSRVFSVPPLFPVARAFWLAADRVVGRAGNKLVVVAERETSRTSEPP
jgi:SAM-dependent methyltransferase